MFDYIARKVLKSCEEKKIQQDIELEDYKMVNSHETEMKDQERLEVSQDIRNALALLNKHINKAFKLDLDVKLTNDADRPAGRDHIYFWTGESNIVVRLSHTVKANF